MRATELCTVDMKRQGKERPLNYYTDALRIGETKIGIITNTEHQGFT